MQDRILKFIESENITAAEFADKIGVQRSSVSHVLNGRNKPGFAFIQKILEAFPSLNSRWLLTGSGQMLDKSDQKLIPSTGAANLFSTLNQPEQHNAVPQVKSIEQSEKQEDNPKPSTNRVISSDEKEVVRVLIFYSDHTFEDFRPAK